ncbi:MAG: hypothetical protein LBI14_03670 [Treponema sp.]|jgi:hypothetical protein|nr:hypothetical protein [Treponema sp.]
MKTKLIVLCVFLCVSPLFAQNQTAGREEIWVTAVIESSFFSVKGLALGEGIAIGYGDDLSFGLRVVYISNMKDVKALEFNFLLRYYLPRLTANSGFFIQFNGGPVLFAQNDSKLAMPAESGSFSAGLSFGWRLYLRYHLYFDATIRAGYPYLVGIGLSAGVYF